ncbi:hypothetical protein AVEN_189682-1 [Araneus ventricosus]|uniref:Uncharacterized protein n=1 Tax=Araneus ventricosus TaxID=182803 RepID=A0A4Y2RQ30_ARAVE|nr:hypothetical protein AVEN_189682-1 [Araneus ventricosus]
MGIPGEWSHWPRPWRPFWRRNVGSQKYWNFLDISNRGRDPYLSRWFHVFLWNLSLDSLDFYPLCELVSCYTPSVIESTVAVLISESLSVCCSSVQVLFFLSPATRDFQNVRE